MSKAENSPSPVLDKDKLYETFLLFQEFLKTQTAIFPSTSVNNKLSTIPPNKITKNNPNKTESLPRPQETKTQSYDDIPIKVNHDNFIQQVEKQWALEQNDYNQSSNVCVLPNPKKKLATQTLGNKSKTWSHFYNSARRRYNTWSPDSERGPNKLRKSTTKKVSEYSTMNTFTFNNRKALNSTEDIDTTQRKMKLLPTESSEDKNSYRWDTNGNNWSSIDGEEGIKKDGNCNERKTEVVASWNEKIIISVNQEETEETGKDIWIPTWNPIETNTKIYNDKDWLDLNKAIEKWKNEKLEFEKYKQQEWKNIEHERIKLIQEIAEFNVLKSQLDIKNDTISTTRRQWNSNTNKAEEYVFKIKEHKESKLIKTSKGKEGNVVNKYDDDHKEIVYRSGTKKWVYKDGYQIVYFVNGDIKQTFSDHYEYLYKMDEVIQFSFNNGWEVFKYRNGQIEKIYKDGKTEVFLPDGSKKWII